MSTEREKRRQLVVRAARRLLDVPDDTAIEDLQTALESVGIDVENAVERVAEFIKEYPKRLLNEAKSRQEEEQQTFERFQRELSSIPTKQIQAQIQLLLAQLPPHSAVQMRAHYRELSAVTGDDSRSEFLDLLWQLKKTEMISR